MSIKYVCAINIEVNTVITIPGMYVHSTLSDIENLMGIIFSKKLIVYTDYYIHVQLNMLHTHIPVLPPVPFSSWVALTNLFKEKENTHRYEKSKQWCTYETVKQHVDLVKIIGPHT